MLEDSQMLHEDNDTLRQILVTKFLAQRSIMRLICTAIINYIVTVMISDSYPVQLERHKESTPKEKVPRIPCYQSHLLEI